MAKKRPRASTSFPSYQVYPAEQEPCQPGLARDCVLGPTKKVGASYSCENRYTWVKRGTKPVSDGETHSVVSTLCLVGSLILVLHTVTLNNSPAIVLRSQPLLHLRVPCRSTKSVLNVKGPEVSDRRKIIVYPRLGKKSRMFLLLWVPSLWRTRTLFALTTLGHTWPMRFSGSNQGLHKMVSSTGATR